MLYWSGMNSDIEKIVKTCKTCRELQKSKPSLPMKYHDIPTRPWQKVGSDDLFFFGGNEYLIIADYYSLGQKFTYCQKLIP